MSAVDFSAFKEKLSPEDIKDMEKDFGSSNGGNFDELPSGVYPVSLESMELKETSWGTEQISICFKVVDGEYAGRLIFYNGTLDTHFAHGYNATAKLISELTDEEVDKDSILFNITKDTVEEYLVDLYQMLKEAKFSYDLKYTVKKSNKINPNTNEPYINKFFSIEEVFE